MRVDEAVELLEGGRFYLKRVGEGGHRYYSNGTTTIMLKGKDNQILDPAIVHRVRKLAQGSKDSRTLVREAYQNKGDLPMNNFSPGQKVKDALSSRVGEVETVLSDGQVRVRWVGEREKYSSQIAAGQLEYYRPSNGQKEEPEVQQQERPLLEVVPGEPTGTILDHLAGLELAAEEEYDAIIKFLDRVAAYERLYRLSDELGIKVKALPEKLKAPDAEPAVKKPPVVMSLESRQKTVLETHEEARKITTYLEAKSRAVTRTEIAQHFGSKFYGPEFKGALGDLIAKGTVRETKRRNDVNHNLTTSYALTID